MWLEAPTLIATLGFLFCRTDTLLLPMQQGEVICTEIQPPMDCLLVPSSSPSYMHV